MGIIEEYLSLTVKYKSEYGEKTIVLMQVGSFFEVYALVEEDGTYSGSCIREFSRINEMMIANKANVTYKGKKVVMAGFGITVLEKNVKKLQEEGFTIVVYEQDIQGKNTSRSLVEIISPGTYFGNDTKVVSNNTMCIWLQKMDATKITNETIIIGISNVDIYTGRVIMNQFELEAFHNPCTYDELERLVTIHQPSECILVSNLDVNTTKEVMQFVGLDQVKQHIINLNAKDKTKLSEEARNAEKQIYQQEVLNRFFPNNEEVFISLLQENYVAFQSLTLLLDFIYCHSPYLVSKLTFPEIQASGQRLTLANHTLKQLNILDDDRHTGKYRSVSSLLNNCNTIMGKRRFTYMLCNPITNSEKLTESYDITEHLLTTSWEEYRRLLSNICDLEKLSRKIVLKRTTPKDLAILGDDLEKIIEIYSKVKKDPLFFEYINKNDDSAIDILSKQILSYLEESFDLKACSQIDDLSPDRLILNNASDFFIRKGTDTEIDHIRNNGIHSRAQLDAIQKYLCSCIGDDKSRGGQPIKIHETAKQNPTLQLTKRRSVLLKTKLSKESSPKILSYIASNPAGPEGDGESKFEFCINNLDYIPAGNSKSISIVTNDQIESICNGVQVTKDKLVQHYISFYSKFMEKFQKFLSKIELIIHFVTLIDIEQCRCYIANKYNYCKPYIEIGNKSYFKAKGIRHPLIEHLQTREIYVTNDISLGCEEDKNGMDGLLLYGTNAVGKTSLIKSIGISIIMAQAGLYVPCSKFIFSPYSRIFSRILGADNIFKGLSTFAVEMSELRAILNQSDKNSLILGDELCSGTESDSALSIFTAGLETLHERKCTFLFATHFHEVCRYEEIKNLNRLCAMHMEVVYNNKLGLLTYDRKLKEGPGDSMYGLEVCKSLNLNPTFLERAHNIRTKYNEETKGILQLSPSKYNAKKLKKGICEMCKSAPAVEVHHLAHQANANEQNQYIDSFHKNHPANLMNLCESCHDKIHESSACAAAGEKQHRRVKTSEGYTLTSI